MKSQQALQDTPGPGPGASVGTWESESESESFSVLCDSMQPCGLYSPRNSPGQNIGVCSLSLLQGIFPTQELDQGLLHCRRILYHLSYKGSPRILEWVAYPSPADPPDPGIEPGSPTLQANSLPSELSGKTLGCREGGEKCLLGGGRRQGTQDLPVKVQSHRFFGLYHGYWLPCPHHLLILPTVAGPWAPTSYPHCHYQ